MIEKKEIDVHGDVKQAVKWQVFRHVIECNTKKKYTINVSVFRSLGGCFGLSFPVYCSHVHIVPYVLPRSLCGWPRTSLHLPLLEEGHNYAIVRFAYLCHMIGEELVFFPFLYIKLSELGVEVAFNNRSVVTHNKVNLLIFSLIDCDPIRLPSPGLETVYKKRRWIEVAPCLLTFFDWHCHLYSLCLLRQIFLAADRYKLFSLPQRAHVTFFVKRDKLEHTFWLLCSMHVVIQVPPD